MLLGNISLKKLNKNEIYKLLIKYKLIKNKNLSTFHNQTRDNKKLKSYIDTTTDIIFLEKTKKNIYYKNKKTRKNAELETNTCYGKFRFNPLNDTQRRLNQFNKFIKNKTILDFGCGSGDFLFKSKNFFKKGIGIELDFKRIKYANNKNINFFRNIKEIIKLNLKFDTIFLFHVFEHLTNPDQILIELKSRLKKNGNLIIEVPHANDLLLKKLSVKSFVNFTLWSEHLILHTKESLKCFLKKAGFNNSKIFFYQRYNLNNHIGWAIYDKGGGHIFFKKVFNKKALDQYNNSLVENEYTDTIFSIAKNR